jgi:predicted chitinase
MGQPDPFASPRWSEPATGAPSQGLWGGRPEAPLCLAPPASPALPSSAPLSSGLMSVGPPWRPNVFDDKAFLKKFVKRIGYASAWNGTAEAVQEVLVNDRSSLLWLNRISNDVVQMSHFLGQCAKETGGFSELVESHLYTSLAAVRGFSETAALSDKEAEALRVRRRRDYEAEWDGFVEKQRKRLAEKHLTEAEFAKTAGAEARGAFLAQVPAWQRDAGRRFFNKVYSNRGEGQLGNTGGDDGWNFRGRGLIHITGRYNYGRAEAALKRPLTAMPELLEQPGLAVDSAAWYWCSELKRVNALIGEARDAAGRYTDSALDAAMSRRVTKRVNSGEKQDGIDARFRFTRIAFEMLGGASAPATK